MNKVMQTRTDEKGNCFSACLATMLGLQIEDVPNFFDLSDGDDDLWWASVREWLKPRNLGLLTINANQELLYKFPGAYLIVAGKSIRDRYHAVIYKNGEMVHDPHPSNAGLETIEYIDLLYPLNLQKEVRQ